MLSNSAFLSSSNVQLVVQLGSWASRISMSDINCFSTFERFFGGAVANLIVRLLF